MIIYQPNEISADETIYLFEVLKKYDVKCGLDAYPGEGSSNGTAIGIRSALVDIKSFTLLGRSDLLVVTLDHTDFLFESDKQSFGKNISDRQIMIRVSHKSGDFTADFHSDFVPAEGIEEARNYGGEVMEEEL